MSIKFLTKISQCFLIVIILFFGGCGSKAEKAYNRAKKYVTSEQYDEAVVEYNEAVKLDPNYVKAYYRLGKLLMKMEKYDEALDAFESALKIDDSKANCYRYIVDIYMIKNEKEKALALCERALSKIDNIKIKEELKKEADKLLAEMNSNRQDKLKVKEAEEQKAELEKEIDKVEKGDNIIESEEK